MTIWTYVTGWALLHFVWQGTVVALLTAGALRLLRGAAATVQYGAACAGLVVMIAVPVFTGTMLMRQMDGAAFQETLVSAPPPTPVLDTTSTRTSVSAGAPRSPSALTLDAIVPLLVPIWLTGVALLALRLGTGAWRVHRLHRAALRLPASRWFADASRVAARLGVRGRLRVVDAALVDTPTVIGWLRPIVLLPVAALANLSAEQVEAILAHELAHIRRHDYLVNLLQTVAETLLFYHPAVWWLSARIRAEREHCCDDIAVHACGDAVRYAEALTELAAWGKGCEPLAVGAASGSLLRRVRRILRTPGHSHSGWRQSVAVVLTMIFLAAGALTVVARADTPIDDGRGLAPQDVNRILGYELFPTPKPYPTDEPVDARAWGTTITYPGGRMPFMGFSARGLIRYAYNLGDLPVVEGPRWLDSQSMSIEASTPSVTPDEGDIRLALRTALEQRFHLTTHRDVRQYPVYALVKDGDSLGPNLRPADGTCLTGEMLRAAADAGRRLPGGQRTTLCGIDNSFFGPTAHGATTGDLARWLRGVRIGIDRDVVDRTGLSGTFDYSLKVGPLPLAAIATARPAIAGIFAPLGVVPLTMALEEQLGLRLEEATASYDVLVIDGAEKPGASAASMAAAPVHPDTGAPRLIRAPWAGVVQNLARFAASPPQVTTGEVAGRVVDQLDNVLPAVEVSLVAGSGRRTTTTDAQGDFTFSDVPPGRYTAFATLPGFRDVNVAVDVRAGVTSTLALPMAVGMIQETMTVVSNAEPPAPVSRPRSGIPPAPSIATPGTVRVGGNIRVPRVATRVWPAYPPGAAASGVGGVVILTGVIGIDGSMNNVHVLSSPNEELSQAAEDAVQQWEFDPTLLDGVPIETLIQVTVDFQLSQ